MVFVFIDLFMPRSGFRTGFWVGACVLHACMRVSKPMLQGGGVVAQHLPPRGRCAAKRITAPTCARGVFTRARESRFGI